ncbi:hypothetical protein MmiHf6_07690 [Methanimicrococcus hongohii]|uniref:Uncharacterized protein n=1 Tax=Methanimicrococcus hongohii TaxID=3028295 RepID=A0AA96VAL3_9EURY|nr:hypothetical protein [Methanimicrococcus sp. Hf6]WNY23462.1 hypothetical protein MmiHf6_07690 [Methanimicrococcus sp. Hf6]
MKKIILMMTALVLISFIAAAPALAHHGYSVKEDNSQATACYKTDKTGYIHTADCLDNEACIKGYNDKHCSSLLQFADKHFSHFFKNNDSIRIHGHC